MTAAADPARYPVVPWPRSIEPRAGGFALAGAGIRIGDADLEPVAETLAAHIRAHTLAACPIDDDGAIRLALDPAAPEGDEAYALEISVTGIDLRARTARGARYGVETVRQLIAGDGSVPACRIQDGPRFRHRGLHLDVSRHFFPLDFVKKYIDTLATFKLNTFHWHLTDDQGWRLEIEKYPRLTEIGAWRKETIVGHHRTGPHTFDGVAHGGYYTQAEAREVVAYARERGVTVIPEIEMPGHTVAALAAYPELACTPGPFEVRTAWGISPDVMCPGEPTFAFLEDVLREVIDIFPGEYVHIGGDEVPKTRWQESAVAQEVIRRAGLAGEDGLQSWFVQRIGRFLAANGRRLIGWDEILEGGLAPDATVMSWRGTAGGIAAARQGHDVVMCPQEDLYFDHYQGDPASEPLAIGHMTTLEETYRYDPVPAELTAAEATHILGAQGCVWTEYMPTAEQVMYMAYPRALALAELTWSPPEAREWTSFEARLPSALGLLDRLGVRYRPPSAR